jgi:hypothetical protein
VAHHLLPVTTANGFLIIDSLIVCGGKEEGKLKIDPKKMKIK